MLLVLLCPLARVGVGWEPAQRAVGALLIVAVGPGGDEFASMVDVVEHCVVKELVAHTVAQGLDEPVVPGPARGDEHLERVILAGPLLERAGKEGRRESSERSRFYP